MDNTREKLIELLVNSPGLCTLTGKTEEFAENADWLIANGVTFATDNKWIPVTERLPEDDSDVLAYLRIGEEGRIYPANYASGMWFDCIFNTPATETTTHWMPMPQPPKED